MRAAHPVAYPLLRGIRRPVVRVPGLGVVVTDAALLRSVVMDTASFAKQGPGSPSDLWTPVLGPRVLLNMEGAEHAELRRAPHLAHHIAWAYAQRPLRPRLREAAAVLRRFDARGWTDLALPPTVWVVAGRDRVLAPGHQRASARHFGAALVEIDVAHSNVVRPHPELLELFESVGAEWRDRRRATSQ